MRIVKNHIIKKEALDKLKQEKLVKTFNNKTICFDYYTKKYLKKQDKYEILGTITINDFKKKGILKDDLNVDEKGVFLQLLSLEDEEVTESDKVWKIDKSETKGSTIGYLKVDTYKYVRIAKPSIYVPLLLFLLLGLFVLFLIKPGSPDPNKPTIKNDGDATTITNGAISEAGQGEIEIPGYSSLYASKKEPNIQLSNPKVNDVYFKYIIKDTKTDKTIFESDLIEPGKALLWDAGNELKKGEYVFNFYIQTFDIKTLANCEGACNRNVSLIIK